MIPAAKRPYGLYFWAVLILLLACLPATASKSNYAWLTRVWKTDEGLPDNNVEDIVQSSDGYLWIVTSAGLVRFDGISFNRFPTEGLTTTNDPHIQMAVPGRSGVLWMVSDDGRIFGLNQDFSTVLPPQTDLSRVPSAVAEAKDGSLWLGYAGSPWTGHFSAVYRIHDGVVTEFDSNPGTPSGNFHALTSDELGNIWLAKGRQVCLFRNGKFHMIANNGPVDSMAPTRTNAVWFAVTSHLFRCNAQGVLDDYGAYQNPTDPQTLALLEDHTGAVWIGTDGNGLFRYTKLGFEKVETSHSTILSLAEDREGNIWVGTAGGGLDRISLNGVRLETLDDNRAPRQIQSMCQDSYGVLWGATQNGALVSRIHDQWTIVLTNAPFAGNARCVTTSADGVLWIGLRGGQLVRVDNTNYAILHLTNNVRSSIFGILSASSGDLWIVRRDILQCLRDGQLKNVPPPRPVERISAIAEDAAGNIWMGANGAVMRFDGKNFEDETQHLPILKHTVCCLYGTPDGSMWISCSGLGLLQFKNGLVGQVGVAQGLLDDNISQIVSDGQGWLWFGSDHGIFKIQQKALEQAMGNPDIHLRPIVYGKNEGLISVEALLSTAPPFVLPCAISDRDGLVWLLTHTGVIMANPKILPEGTEPPAVLLTGVAIDGQIAASYGDKTRTSVLGNLKNLNALRLPPSHRHLEFDFTAFHFSAPENIRFRYQLVGFDNDWVDAGTSRTATYSRLTAGDYIFHVEACIGDGPWSEPATLAFTVTRFFWQTWWFRIGALMIFTASVIAIVRYVSFRRLQQEMRLLEQRATLDKERTRIARDLHDDLGGSLNRVALTLDMTQRGLGQTETINGKIGHCTDLVRQVARSLDEIVWAINPRNDTLRYMVDYISQYAVEFLHAADIRCRVDLPDHIPDQMVSPEARHNLLLAVKEALNNIARHARATEVHVRITVPENQVTVSIEDNGQGFEHTPDNASCDGLRNMRQRMEEINGQFQLESRPGAGTRVIFLYSCHSIN